MKIINPNHNFSTTRKLTSDPLQYPILSPPNPERKGEGGLRTKEYFKHSYGETSELSEKITFPLVTIITVVFNGEKHLEQTIQSVINQTYDNVDCIVIDGGSRDGKIDHCKSRLNLSL